MMMTSNQPYMLRAIHQWILDNDLTPHILVNAQVAGVEVPVQSVQNGQIVLNIAPHAISNIIMDNEAVSFSARFSGVVESLYIPVHAIRAIYASENGQGLVFPEDEIEQDAEEELTVIENEDNSSAETDTAARTKPPFLKVIK